MQVDIVQRLGDSQRSEVLSLVEAATMVDGTAPLSEQVLLAARAEPTEHAETSPGPIAASPHFLAYAGPHLAGYAHLEPGSAGGAGEAATAEVVVDPNWRRKGVGTALVRALRGALEGAPDEARPVALEGAPEQVPGSRAKPLRLWSHGHLDAARAFAVRDGYSITRELWQMRRPLRSDSSQDGPGPLPAISLPEGFRSRHFVVGQDEDAWLRVNARAFADHPEQGRMTRHDLDLRISEPWFDPRGLILVEDTRGPAPVLAASHWTKVVPAQRPQTGPDLPQVGEVYVVGVDPAYQGVGLGRAVTVLGLVHLREQGLTEAMLYVDADNRAAVATYSRLGFTLVAVDVMYSPAVHPPV